MSAKQVVKILYNLKKDHILWKILQYSNYKTKINVKTMLYYIYISDIYLTQGTLYNCVPNHVPKI